MKTKLAFFLILFAVISSALPACTSFAVYGSEAWYGMNFDYPQTPIAFRFDHGGSLKSFRAVFGDGGLIAGMNQDGLFANFQILNYNRPADEPKAGASTRGLGDTLFSSLSGLSSCKAVRDGLGASILIQ